MFSVSYDLHIHTCLSPCGDDMNTPANVVGTAALKGLDVIAITDHNSALNCPAAMRCGEAYGVIVIPGIELTTEEEVHVVCLFPTLDDALGFSEYVYEHLQPVKNNPAIFGHQQVVDEDDNILREIDNLLINATDIGFSDIPKAIAPFHGLMIPAHVDKDTTSLFSNLGFVPPDSTFTCFECKNMKNLHALRTQHEYLRDCRVITDSDAHYIDHINDPVNFLDVKEKSIAGVLDLLSHKFE